MITINMWKEYVSNFYIDFFEIFIAVFLTPITIFMDIILMPIELIALIIYKIIKNNNFHKRYNKQ